MGDEPQQSTAPQGEIVFHYDARIPARLAGYCFATAAFTAAVVVALVLLADFTQWFSFVLVAIFLLPTIMYSWRGMTVRRRLSHDGGHAISISDEGVRLDGSGLLPWERIDLLLIDGRVGGYGPINSMILENALLGVNHIKVSVFEPTAQEPYRTRTFTGAYDRALPGRRDDFVHIARQLRAAAAAHPHVRLRIAERFQWFMKDWIGEVQAYSTVEEVRIGTERGLAVGGAQRKEPRGDGREHA